MSMGDSLSDAHANLKDAFHDHYRETTDSMPIELQTQVLKAMETLENARKAIDYYEVTGKVKA